MQTILLVTVDTEEDNQWIYCSDYSVENIQSLPRLQALCEAYNAKPTYLLTYGVATSPDAQVVLRELSSKHPCEVGAHLHPWFTPPYRPPLGFAAFPHTYPTECDDELLRQKLVNLTQAIEALIGAAPTSYRAGRYGFDGRTANILIDLGYTVDSSVTPLHDWSSHPGTLTGGPNFVDAPLLPYYIDPDDLFNSCSERASRLLEVPITIRARTSPLDTVWLRPYPWSSVEDLISLCSNELQRGASVLNMMFHSSELMVGGSPYTPTQQAVDVVYHKIERVLAFLQNNNVLGMTLSEFADFHTHVYLPS